MSFRKTGYTPMPSYALTLANLSPRPCSGEYYETSVGGNSSHIPFHTLLQPVPTPQTFLSCKYIPYPFLLTIHASCISSLHHSAPQTGPRFCPSFNFSSSTLRHLSLCAASEVSPAWRCSTVGLSRARRLPYITLVGGKTYFRVDVTRAVFKHSNFH